MYIFFSILFGLLTLLDEQLVTITFFLLFLSLALYYFDKKINICVPIFFFSILLYILFHIYFYNYLLLHYTPRIIFDRHHEFNSILNNIGKLIFPTLELYQYVIQNTFFGFIPYLIIISLITISLYFLRNNAKLLFIIVSFFIFSFVLTLVLIIFYQSIHIKNDTWLGMDMITPIISFLFPTVLLFSHLKKKNFKYIFILIISISFIHLYYSSEYYNLFINLYNYNLHSNTDYKKDIYLYLPHTINSYVYPYPIEKEFFQYMSKGEITNYLIMTRRDFKYLKKYF